jgi:thiol-disulfide isomerase/thioredoxin
MKVIVLIAALLLPRTLFAQKAGIQFKEYGSWDDVLEASKAQHKDIFIDAYTTWCGPCKKMDAEVYNDLELGNYINDNFIAIKIQFDRTDHDNEEVKKWYSVAAELQKKYSIKAFPTLLFVSPDDQLFDRITGYYSVGVLLDSIQKIINPKSSFLSMVERYKGGTLALKDYPGLAIKAKDLKHDSLASEIAKEYKLKVIDGVLPEKFINPQLRIFMIYFGNLFTVNDQLSNYIYAHPQTADSGFKEKYSNGFIEYLATRTYIDPLMFPNGKYIEGVPNWKLMERNIREKYDKDLAYRLMLGTKISYYTRRKDWGNAIRYMIDRTDYLGVDTVGVGAMMVNNMVYNVIFKYSTDIKQLKKGIAYMRVLISKEKDDYVLIDTYANMLYKTGKRGQAISEQERALVLAKQKNDVDAVKELNLALNKMLRNVPTWTE